MEEKLKYMTDYQRKACNHLFFKFEKKNPFLTDGGHYMDNSNAMFWKYESRFAEITEAFPTAQDFMKYIIYETLNEKFNPEELWEKYQKGIQFDHPLKK